MKKTIASIILILLFINVQVVTAAFVNNGDGTVTQDSSLMWQQADDNIRRTYYQAVNYCQNLTLAGYDDWRLPYSDELPGLLIRFSGMAPPFIDPVFSCHQYHYWSDNQDPEYGWLYSCYFGAGIIFNGNDEGYCGYGHISEVGNYLFYVRCVRTYTPPITYSLNISKSGNGNGLISSSPTGINCGYDCSESYK